LTVGTTSNAYASAITTFITAILFPGTNYVGFVFVVGGTTKIACALYSSGTFGSPGAAQSFESNIFANNYVTAGGPFIMPMSATCAIAAYRNATTVLKACTVQRVGTALTVNTSVTLTQACGNIQLYYTLTKINSRVVTFGFTSSTTDACGYELLEISPNEQTVYEEANGYSILNSLINMVGSFCWLNQNQLIVNYINTGTGLGTAVVTMANNYGNWLGFAQATVAPAGAPIILTDGYTTMFSGLTPNAAYYLAPGGLITTQSDYGQIANTTAAKAGIAIGAAKFIIQD
jgi:hypothetical protein